MRKRLIIFLDTSWSLGGGTIFNINLGRNLQLLFENNRIIGLSQSVRNSIVSAVSNIPFEIIIPDRDHPLKRRRISSAIELIRKHDPDVLVLKLDTELCEIARNSPSSITKIGVLHVLDPDVFEWTKIYGNYFDAFVCVSPLALIKLTTIAPELAHKSFFIPPGITTPPKDYHKQINADRPLRLLYLGRLDEASKRVRSIPKIATILKSRGIPYLWTIAGDGSEKQFLKTEAKHLTLSDIEFKGIIPQDELPSLFKGHDVIVSTSDLESYPLTLHEAMAWGLVPVAGRISGTVEEIVSLSEGYLVDPNEPEQFADAIAALHANRDRLKKTSILAMELMKERKTWHKVSEQWHELIEAIKKPKSLDEKTFTFGVLPPLRLHQPGFIFSLLERLFYELMTPLDRHFPVFSDWIQGHFVKIAYNVKRFLGNP
ncbi:MAG: glycosyltransferase family 4 protein [Verrucomicrobia bacterium]|nr:glycosyltransferase family 4 protein [Verrucomicrobiota bacterium]